MSASIRRMVAVAGSALGAALLSLPPIAGAVDIPVTPKKLVVVTKGSKAKTVFVAKDPAITKGAGTDVSAISVGLLLFYDGEAGSFGVSAGAYDGTRGWIVNKDTVAKYVDKTAPAVSDTKVALVKPGKLLKLVAKGLGDEPLNILGQGAPTGLGRVYAQYFVTNGGEEYRHCAVFAECIYKELAGGTGAKLLCKRGAPDPLCGEPPVACGDATAPACDGACPAGQTCLSFFGAPCACGDAVDPIAGACGELAGAPTCLGECPPAAPLCVVDAESGECTCSNVLPCGDSSAPECNGACPSGQFCQPVADGLICGCRTDDQCMAGGLCQAGGCSPDCPPGYFCFVGPMGAVCIGPFCDSGCGSCPPGGNCVAH